MQTQTVPSVWRLGPDNFTPPARTPWGGQRIKSIKAGLSIDPEKADYACVGESWEVSTDSTFPSRVINAGGLPLARLAPDLRYLVKILDTAEPLSVQVHPTDAWESLGPTECGKPEAWFIYAAEPGAGVYLGFREGVGRDDIRRCLAVNGPLHQLMDFAPVKTGDVFEITPGLAHALGPGVTLVEPQGIVPGKSGVTYRFWDWNRLYGGKPRPLHLEQSLAVVDLSQRSAAARRSDAVFNERFRAQRVRAVSETVTALKSYVVLEGEITAGDQRFLAGESFLVTAGVRVTCRDAWAVSVEAAPAIAPQR